MLSRAEVEYDRKEGAYFSNLIYRAYDKAKLVTNKLTLPEEVVRIGDHFSGSIESVSYAIGGTSNTGCHF